MTAPHETPVDDLRRDLRRRLISYAMDCGTPFLKIEALDALAEHTGLPDPALAILVRTAVTTVDEIRDAIALAAKQHADDPDAPRRTFNSILAGMWTEVDR